MLKYQKNLEKGFLVEASAGSAFFYKNLLDISKSNIRYKNRIFPIELLLRYSVLELPKHYINIFISGGRQTILVQEYDGNTQSYNKSTTNEFSYGYGIDFVFFIANKIPIPFKIEALFINDLKFYTSTLYVRPIYRKNK